MKKIDILDEFSNLFLESTKISKKLMKLKDKEYQIKGINLFLKISRSYLPYHKENLLDKKMRNLLDSIRYSF